MKIPAPDDGAIDRAHSADHNHRAACPASWCSSRRFRGIAQPQRVEDWHRPRPLPQYPKLSFTASGDPERYVPAPRPRCRTPSQSGRSLGILETMRRNVAPVSHGLGVGQKGRRPRSLTCLPTMACNQIRQCERLRMPRPHQPLHTVTCKFNSSQTMQPLCRGR